MISDNADLLPHARTNRTTAYDPRFPNQRLALECDRGKDGSDCVS
jgi:hypothetical protein